jgi:hypothetical protein
MYVPPKDFKELSKSERKSIVYEIVMGIVESTISGNASFYTGEVTKELEKKGYRATGAAVSDVLNGTTYNGTKVFGKHSRRKPIYKCDPTFYSNFYRENLILEFLSHT